MTGRLELPEPSNEHVCTLPEIRTWDPDVRRPGEGYLPSMPIVHTLPVGTRFYCVCGEVWVVHMEPDVRGPRAHIIGGPIWERETRAERRARLGLRWWQRDRG